MRRGNYPIVFGASESPNKGLILGKADGHIEIRIGEVKGEYSYGDTYKSEDFIGEYAELWFCKKESLIAFKRIIEEGIRIWDMTEEELWAEEEAEKEQIKEN